MRSSAAARTGAWQRPACFIARARRTSGMNPG
jgi:hypothetical protein